MLESTRRPSVSLRRTLGLAIGPAAGLRLLIFGALLATALHLTLTFQFLPSRYALNEGDVSPYDVKSPAKVVYVSQIRTNADRLRASSAVPEIYRPVTDAGSQAQAAATSVLNQIGQIRADPSPNTDRIAKLTGLPGIVITPDLAATLLAFDDIQWRDTVTATLRTVDRTMRLQITPQQVDDVKAKLPNQIDPGLDDREASAVISLSRGFIGATLVIDQAATTEARRQAADAVQPTRITVEKGETILRNGDVVQLADLEKLEAVGLRNPAINWSEILAMALISITASGLLCSYVYRFRPVIAQNPKRLLLLGVLLIVPILAAKLTIPGRELYSYLFPIAAAPMLLTILLDVDISLVVVAIQAAAIGLVVTDSIEPVLAMLIAGGIGAIWVHRLERVNTIWTAAGLVSVANFAVIAAFQLVIREVDAQQLLLYFLLAVISGIMSAALTLGMVSFLGHVFGIATTMNLLELAHPSQPLFRRLLTDAPGTYHHSVVVANLAERAAATIGGDTLLARIGGYYHDIGKLTRPYAFIENQIDGQNVHDDMDPVTSARLILAHVTDGLDLATRNGIPARVKDMIAQHHGTMLVQYFFWRATQTTDGPVDDSLFRYGGPKPQTREAGIMMLADGVEATVRANRDHSTENITAIVDR
ncbi:MAG TPA: HDIG domain-containing protein, partial [Chloroflexota bacterium]|nr:HDIG domain-containing protein [Chloroflexota bacterium]